MHIIYVKDGSGDSEVLWFVNDHPAPVTPIKRYIPPRRRTIPKP